MKTFPSPSLLPGIEKWKAPILSPAEIHLYLLRFDPEIEPPWVQEYRDILSAEERKSCDSMGSFDRRREYLLSRLMARFFLSGYTSQKMKSLTFTRSEYGKPFLQNFPLPFNLSHTQGLIALAVGRMELGVDIEKVETTMESESRCQILARRFFTREESDFIETLPQNEKSRGFFRLFTLKEAMGKAMGTGLKGAFTLGNIPLPPGEVHHRKVELLFQRF